MRTTADVLVSNQGTIVMLLAKTPAAQAWCDQHLPDDCPRQRDWYCVEHRYAPAIIAGMDDYGLLVRESVR